MILREISDDKNELIEPKLDLTLDELCRNEHSKKKSKKHHRAPEKTEVNVAEVAQIEGTTLQDIIHAERKEKKKTKRKFKEKKYIKPKQKQFSKPKFKKKKKPKPKPKPKSKP